MLTLKANLVAQDKLDDMIRHCVNRIKTMKRIGDERAVADYKKELASLCNEHATLACDAQLLTPENTDEL